MPCSVFEQKAGKMAAAGPIDDAYMSKLAELRDKTVLVTGGNGFLGRHIVERLLECGANVRVFDLAITEHNEEVMEVYLEITCIPYSTFKCILLVVSRFFKALSSPVLLMCRSIWFATPVPLHIIYWCALVTAC